MKCPLTYTATLRGGSYDISDAEDCLKEECAWWSRDMEECSIVSISFNLWAIRGALTDIMAKLPSHERLV